MRTTTLLLLAALAAPAQHNDANYDESKVPNYTLPDPLLLSNGKRVTNPKAWTHDRRPELLEIFRREMYGRSPAKPEHMTFELTAVDHHSLGGKADRKEVTVYFAGKKDGPKMDILTISPPASPGRCRSSSV